MLMIGTSADYFFYCFTDAFAVRYIITITMNKFVCMHVHVHVHVNVLFKCDVLP